MGAECPNNCIWDPNSSPSYILSKQLNSNAIEALTDSQLTTFTGSRHDRVWERRPAWLDIDCKHYLIEEFQSEEAIIHYTVNRGKPYIAHHNAQSMAHKVVLSLQQMGRGWARSTVSSRARRQRSLWIVFANSKCNFATPWCRSSCP